MSVPQTARRENPGRGTSDGTFADGNFDIAMAIGPAVFKAPFDDIADKLILTQPFMQRASAWQAAVWGTRHPTFVAYELVDETEPVSDGALVTWDRIYAKTPPERDIYESFSYPLQFTTVTTTNGVVTNVSITEVACNVLSRVHFVYGPRDSVRYIQTRQTFRYFILAGGLHYIGDPPAGQGGYMGGESPLLVEDPGTGYGGSGPRGKEVVAEDSQIRQWKGNIWQYAVRYVDPNLTSGTFT